MPIFKNRKEKNFTVLDNQLLQNKELSWKARGILTYLLSLPEDWDVNTKELATHADDGITSLRNGLKELREAGYIIYKKYQDEEGKFVHEYNVYEKPHTEKPDMENPNVDYPDMENRDINKELNEQRTKEQKNNIKNKPSDNSDTDTGDKFSLQGQTDGGYYIYPDEYEEIYELYPANKGSKKAGWRKWAATRRRGISKEDLTTAVSNYAKVCEREDRDKKYVKHIGTFFGPDEHWKEYLELDEENINDNKKRYRKAADF